MVFYAEELLLKGAFLAKVRPQVFLKLPIITSALRQGRASFW